MSGTIKHLVKKVTLELIYDVVDERTQELIGQIRAADHKLDSVGNELRAEIIGVRNELKSEILSLKEDSRTLSLRLDQIHMRLDQLMQMLVDLKK